MGRRHNNKRASWREWAFDEEGLKWMWRAPVVYPT